MPGSFFRGCQPSCSYSYRRLAFSGLVVHNSDGHWLPELFIGCCFHRRRSSFAPGAFTIRCYDQPFHSMHICEAFASAASRCPVTCWPMLTLHIGMYTHAQIKTYIYVAYVLQISSYMCMSVYTVCEQGARKAHCLISTCLLRPAP